MNRVFDVDAVLFDLDGTLLDTIPDLWVATNRMLAELGQAPRMLAEVTAFVGKGIPNLVQRALTEGRDVAPTLAAGALAAFERHYAAVNGEETRPYPGVLATLDALAARGLRMACVTNKAEAFVHPLMARMEIADYFTCVVGGDTLPTKKPDPEPVWHACKALGVSLDRVLMVGDSGNDAAAARRAGIPVLLLTYGYSEGAPVDTIECDGLVSSFPELLEHIQPGSTGVPNDQ